MVLSLCCSPWQHHTQAGDRMEGTSEKKKVFVISVPEADKAFPQNWEFQGLRHLLPTDACHTWSSVKFSDLWPAAAPPCKNSTGAVNILPSVIFYFPRHKSFCSYPNQLRHGVL